MSVQAALAQLAQSLGAAQWSTDPARCALFAQDVFATGEPLAAVLRPADVQTLALALPTLTDAGVAIVARGGGLSYTDGYLATQTPCVAVDLSALDQVLEINLDDRFVRVQAGCTWAALDKALAAHGVRTPYWGPLSGLGATVGGALSQNSTFLGSGTHGAVGDSLLGLDVLTASGQHVRSGALAVPQAPAFFRYAGPDLSGLFLGDGGALGIKVEASLRLIARPACVDYLSFQCVDIKRTQALMSEIARQGLASECFGFDPVLAQVRMRRAGLVSDVKTLGQVVRKQGLLGGLKLVGAGRNFLDPSQYSVHLAIEADDEASVRARLSAARRAAAGVAREVDNSIPKVLRSAPFAPPNSMLGPNGERWVPVHGILPHSRALPAIRAVAALIESQREALDRHAIVIGQLLTTVGAQGFLFEPVFYWPDALSDYHRAMVQPDHLAKLATHPEALAARALVGELKRAIADTMYEHGAAHFQIGKFYRWREGRDAGALALFDAIKRQLDPHGLMNPGVLMHVSQST